MKKIFNGRDVGAIMNVTERLSVVETDIAI